jgi:hypothetical protein
MRTMAIIMFGAGSGFFFGDLYYLFTDRLAMAAQCGVLSLVFSGVAVAFAMFAD